MERGSSGGIRTKLLSRHLSDAYSVEPQDTLCAAQNPVLCVDMLPEATQKTLIQIRIINTEDAKPVFLLSMRDGYEVLFQLVSILDTIPLHKGD